MYIVRRSKSSLSENRWFTTWRFPLARSGPARLNGVHLPWKCASAHLTSTSVCCFKSLCNRVLGAWWWPSFLICPLHVYNSISMDLWVQWLFGSDGGSYSVASTRSRCSRPHILIHLIHLISVEGYKKNDHISTPLVNFNPLEMHYAGCWCTKYNCSSLCWKFYHAL